MEVWPTTQELNSFVYAAAPCRWAPQAEKARYKLQSDKNAREQSSQNDEQQASG